MNASPLFELAPTTVATGYAPADPTAQPAIERASEELANREAPALTIRVYGTPGPQGSKKARAIYRGKGPNREFTGKVSVQESSQKVKPWREAVQDAAAEAMPGLPLVLDGMLRADMVFTLPRPKGRPSWWPKGWPWSRDMDLRPAGYPDLSKLARSTEDALTLAGAWRDDGRVVEYGRLAKFFPNTDPDALDAPGAVIRIYTLGEPQ